MDDQTLDALGPATALRRTVAAAPYTDRFQTRIGSGTTPQYVFGCLRRADTGYLYQLVDLLEECLEADSHLLSLFSKRVSRLSAAPWELRLPAATGDAGREIVQFCEEALRSAEGDAGIGLSFHDLVAHLQAACFYGVSAAEARWTFEGRWAKPVRWEMIHPRRLAFATDWRMHLWDAVGPGGPEMGTTAAFPAFSTFPGVPLDVFPQGKFVRHRGFVRPGSYPTRDGLGRTVVWMSVFKRFAIRDWMGFLEWAGRGLRWARFRDASLPGANAFMGALSEDVNVVLQMLQNWSSSVSMVAPSSVEDMGIHQPESNGAMQMQTCSYFDDQMSKAMLGGTLTTDGGTVGARSLGTVHAEAEERLMASDGVLLASGPLRRDILRPLVWLNFGANAPVPAFEFYVDSTATRMAKAQLYESVGRAGIRVAQTNARDDLGFADPQVVNGVEEPTIGGPALTPAAPSALPSEPT